MNKRIISHKTYSEEERKYAVESYIIGDKGRKELITKKELWL